MRALLSRRTQREQVKFESKLEDFAKEYRQAMVEYDKPNPNPFVVDQVNNIESQLNYD